MLVAAGVADNRDTGVLGAHLGTPPSPTTTHQHHAEAITNRPEKMVSIFHGRASWNQEHDSTDDHLMMRNTQHLGCLGLSFLFQILSAPERLLSQQVLCLYVCNLTSTGKPGDKTLRPQSWIYHSIIPNYIARLQSASNCYQTELWTQVKMPSCCALATCRRAQQHLPLYKHQMQLPIWN